MIRNFSEGGTSETVDGRPAEIVAMHLINSLHALKNNDFKMIDIEDLLTVAK